MKFEKLGRFNYLIWASIDTQTMAKTMEATNKPLIGSLKLYAPFHQEAIFELQIPFAFPEKEKAVKGPAKVIKSHPVGRKLAATS
jgi:ABC-type uncharacterized transport system involved in gliding motility auxiliary subunit